VRAKTPPVEKKRRKEKEMANAEPPQDNQTNDAQKPNPEPKFIPQEEEFGGDDDDSDVHMCFLHCYVNQISKIITSEYK
jgi:hypothetical protein